MEPEVLVKIGKVEVRHFPGASTFFYKSGLNIDADGAPNAYGPKGGLDYLGNAGHPGNWWAVVIDNGKKTGNPVVQGPKDPAPGYYVSTTSLEDRNFPPSDPRRYVDSTAIPYIVIPLHLNAPIVKKKLRHGDLALVVNFPAGSYSYAIYADDGPAGEIGEGSIALAQALGIRADPKHGNSARDVVYVVFPGSGNGQPKTVSEINSIGRGTFETWGGFKRLAECFPEYAPKMPRQ